MPASIDLKKCHLTRIHGDIAAVFAWINDERALFLIPHRRQGAPWFIVAESAAYTWDDSDTANVPAVGAKSRKACEVLGIEPSPTNCRRIAGIVIDSLEDLQRMPAKPEAEYFRGSHGRMELKADGQTLREEDIRMEKEGVTYA